MRQLTREMLTEYATDMLYDSGGKIKTARAKYTANLHWFGAAGGNPAERAEFRADAAKIFDDVASGPELSQ